RSSPSSLSAALFLTALLMLGQHPDPNLESRFESAKYTERVAGDLKSALNQYTAILAGVGKNRWLAAQVLLQIAQCEERLDQRNAARATYTRLVNEYADQQESAASARERLAAWTGNLQGPRNLDFER